MTGLLLSPRIALIKKPLLFITLLFWTQRDEVNMLQFLYNPSCQQG